MCLFGGARHQVFAHTLGMGIGKASLFLPWDTAIIPPSSLQFELVQPGHLRWRLQKAGEAAGFEDTLPCEGKR